MKEISFVNYTWPDPVGQAHQNHRELTPHYVYQPKTIADKIGSAGRQVNFKEKQTIALLSIYIGI
jgi:hypothetical protein